MAHVPAAVHIATTDGPAGRAGLTASSVCGVSDDPPTLLVCLNRNGRSYPIFKANGVMCINTLAIDQMEIAKVFARQVNIETDEKFLAGTWEKGLNGAPALYGALLSFECNIIHIQDIGTHAVIFGEISNIIFQEIPNKNLLYFNRSYRTL